MAEPNGYIQGKDGKPLELVDATARRQLAGKLDAPGNVKAGDYLRVQSIGADGTVVLEGAEAPGGGSGQNVNVFAGKTAFFFGDSLTEKNWHYTKGYHQWVKELLGLASYDNYGVSGYKVSDVYNKVKSVSGTAPLIFVMCGTNDESHSVPLGQMGDATTETTYGSLHLLCAELKSKYPTSIVVFITPTYQTSITHSAGVTNYEISKAIREVCQKFTIPVFDNFVLSGIYPTNLSVFTTDKCHWNDMGHEMVGKNLAAYMLNTFHYVYANGDSGGEDETTVPVTGVSLNATSGTLAVGASTTLTATVFPADATNKAVSWKSSNTSVATVSGGVVVAVSGGTATITATTVDGGFTAEYALTIDAESGEGDSTGFVGKTVKMTGYAQNNLFAFTAIANIDDDAKQGNTVEFRVSGANAQNLVTHTAEWMQLFGDDTGVCSNGKYTNALSDGTPVTATISESNELSAVATYSINTEPTSPNMKVAISLKAIDPAQSSQFTIEQISVVVNGVEKPIIAIGGFFNGETYEII